MLQLQGVTVRFAGRTALDAVDLEVAEHETVCVLGPSGSGKSTLLRVVAGLQTAHGGRVLLSGHDLAGVPVHERGVGLMFQDHQLFPQRDVGGNVAFGLRMRKRKDAEVRGKVAELLRLVGLPDAQRRRITELSGGEQQRVALARALAPQPGVLMLDEPLGQLDRGLREQLVVELRQLFRRLGTRVLAVTHDQGEAFALADRVVVMRNGAIARTGTPMEVWQRPESEFVARFLGFANITDAEVRGTVAATPWGKIPVASGTPDGECRLLVRPGGVRLTAPEDGLRCTVEARTFRGGGTAEVTVLLRPEDGGPGLEASCALSEAPATGTLVGAAFGGGQGDPDPAGDIVPLAG